MEYDTSIFDARKLKLYALNYIKPINLYLRIQYQNVCNNYAC